MGIVIPSVLIFFTCLWVWRACDGFERASEYIGRDLSEGVRGGTINAISSSLPELFTTLIALFILADKDGFSVGIGTTAGSALFNGMIIPAACIFAVIGTVVHGVKVTSINVSSKVILRDGLSLLFCEAVLILLINGNALYWWQGLVLVVLYIAYLLYMILSMKSPAQNEEEQEQVEQENDTDEARSAIGSFFYWLSGGPLLDLESHFIGKEQEQKIKDKTWNGWPLLLASTVVIGIACFVLVKACEWLGTGPGNELHSSYTLFGKEFAGIGMPTMFVAVIFASMATSVPDTVMSIRDAKDGDYDDAVANALGSNIFDICFALGFPLLVYTLIYGPIELSPTIAAESAELRVLLFCLTIIGFVIYFVGRRGTASDGTTYIEMKRGKALLLIILYLVFVIYIFGLSWDASWAQQISDAIQTVLQQLVKFE